ncbi:MAG: DNA-binding response regulator [Bacteroidota bacterium]|nr:DNA-binding response regulator [Bacteroidota bacterium]
MKQWFRNNKLVLLYGLALALLLFLLRWLEFRFLILDHAFEAYVGAIALVFTGLGIWLAMKLARPKVETIIIEKTIISEAPPFSPNEKSLADAGISKREWEVLALMAKGMSNQEIANQLFVSLNTIKTHSSRIFEKLEASRRTQAISKAKALGILP